jgi:hypothetical protein
MTTGILNAEMRRFLAQNERTAATMTDAVALAAEPYADHHSGGLYVLIRSLGGDPERYVKMHDSWGDDEFIVVHAYDPLNPDEGEHVAYLRTAEEAFTAFQNWERIEATAQRAELEILDDIADGTLPATVGSFSELHDYVDANCYGGLCDEEESNPNLSLFETCAYQDLVDAWLRERR